MTSAAALAVEALRRIFPPPGATEAPGLLSALREKYHPAMPKPGRRLELGMCSARGLATCLDRQHGQEQLRGQSLLQLARSQGSNYRCRLRAGRAGRGAYLFEASSAGGDQSVNLGFGQRWFRAGLDRDVLSLATNCDQHLHLLAIVVVLGGDVQIGERRRTDEANVGGLLHIRPPAQYINPAAQQQD